MDDMARLSFKTETLFLASFQSWGRGGGGSPLTEIRFYSCTHGFALAMLKHEVEVVASGLAGDDIH